MTPKEKANELFDKFYLQTEYHINCGCEFLAKENALICVDEMIKERQILNNDFDRDRIIELKEVKQEINKL
tara:strand:- start:3797 stop:4009 length:213 start_codon:yes stop_codon:yes gene_type:complete